MKCKSCGSENTDDSMFCFNCGAKLEKEAPAAEPVAVQAPAAEPVAAQAPETEPVTAQTPAAENNISDNAAQENVPPIQPVFMQNGADTQSSDNMSGKNADGVQDVTVIPADTPTEAKPKKSFGAFIKKYGVIFIAVAAVAVIAIVLLSNIKAITNAAKRAGKPDNYLRWVVEKKTEEANGNVADIYQDYLDVVNLSDENVSGSVSVELNDGAEKYLKQLKKMGVDVTWLNSLKIGYTFNTKDTVSSLNINASVNGVSNLFEADGILDASNEYYYVAFPTISDTYLSAETDDMSDYTEMLEEYDDVIDAMPKAQVVEKLLNNYSDAALSAISSGNVKVSKGKTIKAEGLTQNVTEVKLTIDNELCQDMMLAVIKEAEEDKDLRGVYEDFVKGLEDTELGDEMDIDDWDYDDFLDELDDLEDEIEDYEPLTYYNYGDGEYDDYEVEITFSVDNKGEIVGVEIEYETYWDDVDAKMYKVRQNGKVAYKLETSGIEVTAIGRENGNKFTGDATIEYNDIGIASAEIVNFDTESCKKGNPSGKITITPDEDLFDYYLSSSFDVDVALVLDFDASVKKGNVSVGVLYDGENIAELSVDYNINGGTTVKVPSGKQTVDVEDEDDIEDYFDSVSFDKLIKNLEKANVPDDVIDALEDIDDFDDLEDFLYELGYYF